MNKHMGNFITGIVIGLGFGLASGGIYYLVNLQTMQLHDESWGMGANQVVITHHREEQRAGATVILGSMRHDGEKNVHTPNVQVELLDSRGEFVEQCSAFLSGALMPGETRNFKVKCPGDKDSPTVAHSSYEVKLTSGY